MLFALTSSFVIRFVIVAVMIFIDELGRTGVINGELININKERNNYKN
jgi:hypothetical protein